MALLPDMFRRGERGVWSPIREMNRLQRQFERVFDDFLADPFQSFPRPGQLSREMEEILPACDIEEDDSRYLVSFDLPGMKKEDVKIEVRDNQLTISGERKREREEKAGKGRASRERYYGVFSRSFTLPSNIEADKVRASYDNGVLQIAIPKTAQAGKLIPIQEGKLIEAKSGKAA